LANRVFLIIAVSVLLRADSSLSERNLAHFVIASAKRTAIHSSGNDGKMSGSILVQNA